MKYLFICFLISCCLLNAQQSIELTLLDSKDLKVDQILSVDAFKTLFYIKDNTVYKTSQQGTYNYNTLQLGSITSANSFNPLKINAFYRDFNTVVILDNRLAEIFKIDFNTIDNYKNVTHISTGNDNTIWLYNQDTNQLELYNYLTNTTRAQTLPIAETVLDLKSDYNFCWLLTEQHLYVYNYFGSLIKKIPNAGFTRLAVSNENCILLKKDTLFLLKENTEEVIPLELPQLLINQFLLTNETVYIYDLEKLHRLLIKTN